MSVSSTKVKRILLLTNPGVDMNRPDYRLGTFKSYLFQIADRLRKDSSAVECKFLVGEGAYSLMARDPAFRYRGFDEFLSFRTSSVFTDRAFGDSVLSDIYLDKLTQEEEARLEEEYNDALKGFEPDAIISWEYPVKTLRRMFPKAAVLDLMPGAFMRPPYPKTIAVDPFGIYKDSGIKYLLDGSISPTSNELNTYLEDRRGYESFYKEVDAKNRILKLSGASKSFDHYALLPLQISDYFGYRDNSKYPSQYDLVQSTLQSVGPDTGVIVTQYVSGLAAESVITPENYEFLHRQYGNILYSPAFNKLNNVSQFVAPWADETISVSSTVALQAHFFGKKVTSPSQSHIKFLQESQEVMEPDNAAALLHQRYSLLWRDLSEKPGYLIGLLNFFSECAGCEPKELYENWPAESSKSSHFEEANFARAADMLSDATGDVKKVPNVRVKSLLDSVDRADVVSFDVFDTLLQRKVFHPTDVFLLTPYEDFVAIGGQDEGILTPELYSMLRQSAERTMRVERDKVWEKTDAPEEITSEEIFDRLASYLLLGAKGIGVSKKSKALLQVEQSTEADLLEPTLLGKLLFDRAKSLGKKIIIISDFCHSASFVNEQLSRAGYDGYTLYVSSEHRHKKHSGNLYKHVSDDLDLDQERVVHFGDNPRGDIEKAREHGWNAAQIFLPKSQLQRRLVDRGVDFTAISTSLAFRTAANMFANRYVQDDLRPRLKDVRNDLVRNHEELGYLCLGPLIVGFSRWINEQCREIGAKQVVLFARDCILPYRVLKYMEGLGMMHGVSVYYVAASRTATKSLGITSPVDVFRVNLSDVSRTTTIGNVLWSRFQINADDVSREIWDRFGLKGPNVEVRHASIAAIFQVAFAYLNENWGRLSVEIGERRDAFARYLDGLGVDRNEPTAFVDIGYKGTITKIVSTFFSNQVFPLFMATYPDARGNDPIANPKVYLRDRMATTDSEPFKKYNLLIETILNEAVGSAALIDDKLEVGATVFREVAPSETHVRSVSRMHSGVLDFAKDWYSAFGSGVREPRFEVNKQLDLLAEIFTRPSVGEAALFDGLEFDNNFAGHEPRYLISQDRDTNKSVWREGAMALSYPQSPYQVRLSMIEDGAYVSYDYDTPKLVGDTFKGRVIFGGAGRGTTTVHGVQHRYNWIHDEVSAFKVDSHGIDNHPIILNFINDAHFKIGDFQVWQNGSCLETRLVRLDNRAYGLLFDARPYFPFVVRNPGFRGAANPSKDARRFYWRFVSLQVLGALHSSGVGLDDV